MPRELIYTSAPRGLTPGQSGYCTVARSRDLREALILRLEKLSYYTPDDSNRPICAYRILNVRGDHYHVLTRIVNAGLDFTKRRSFLAHHRVYEPGEVPERTPLELFSERALWLDRWEGEPRFLNEDAGRETGGEIHKHGLDVWIRGGERFPSAWGCAFTTQFQPGDHPEDFEVKVVWPDTPGFEAAKSAGAVFTEAPVVFPEAKKPESAPVQESVEMTEPVVAAKGPNRWRMWVALAMIAPAVFLLLSSREDATTTTPPPPPDYSSEIARAFASPPVTLPFSLLQISSASETVTLPPEIEKHLGTGEYALRPLAKGVDPLRSLEEKAGLLPATTFEMREIREQIQRVLQEMEKSVASMKSEHAELSAREKKALTDEPEIRARIAALDLAMPMAFEELQKLREAAKLVPMTLPEIDQFALFRCQSNVNTEIIRFEATR